MSVDQHTPGPWVIPVANVYRVIALKDGEPYRGIVNDTAPEHSHFGQDDLGWHEGYSDPDSPEGIRMGLEAAANTRLIAAAPDMLAALRAAERYIINGIEFGYIVPPEPSTPDPAHGALPAIRSAIAKATGGGR